MEHRGPDKRNVAYESIFGRPSAGHHRPPGPQSQYTPSVRGAASIRSVYTQNDAYDPRLQQQHQYAQPHFQHPNQAMYYQQPPAAAPSIRSYNGPPPTNRAHHQYPGYNPRPLTYIQEAAQGPPPPPGMTAAQAYQAQVTGQFPIRDRSPGQRQSLMPPPQLSHPPSRPSSNGSGNFLLQPLEENFGEGRLDIAFPATASAAPVDTHAEPVLRHRTMPLDDDSILGREDSELPWASDTARPISDASSTLVDHSSLADFDKMPRPLSVATFKQLAPAGKASPEVTSPSSRPHPLQLNIAMESRLLDDREFTPSPSASISNSTTSAEQLATPSTVARSNSAVHQSQPRRSTELTGPRPQSARTGSLRRDRTVQDRSRSMGAISQPDAAQLSPASNGTVSGHGHSHSQSITGANTKRLRQPLVYPAMLSRVAAALQSRLPLITHIKDGLEYTDAFTGRDAVDKIAYIIKTTDRNLALLLGRALDAQKFFHDVTYDHRLRDSSSEIYRFSTRVAPWGSGEINGVAETTEHDDGAAPEPEPAEPSAEPAPTDDADGEQNLPVGVFTLLTDCYSPTCSRDRLCYSISCPRRVEQQRRQHLKPSGGLRQPAQEILDAAEDPADDAVVETGTLWIHSVPQEVVDSVSDTEKKRQEAINEVMYTERDFVRDVEYLRDVWMKPLLDGSGGVDLADSATFVHNVFWNVADILAVNTKLRDALTKRQKAYAVVDRIGDILLEHVPFFDPFVAYGAHQLLAKVEFEREKAANPSFAVFVEEAERRPESRKLELNAYLTKPTTRLARYPLLLGVALKYTPDDHPDKEDLPKVITMIREFLEAVNQASGKAENAYNIQQLAAQLQFRPGEEVPLRLEDPHRELIFKGQMKRRGGSAAETGDLQIFLFDHAIVMAKQKTKIDALRVVRRPIPLELLVVSCPDDPHASVPSAKQIENKQGFPITFAHLGRKGYTVMLFASTFVARRKWVEHITKQQETLRARSLVFDTTVLSDRFFAPDSGRRVYCAVPFNAGRRVAFGTQDGVYLADLHEEQATQPKHILLLPDVVQVEVLEAQQVLLVLSERTVFAYALDNIDERDHRNNVQLQRRVSSHINFFRAGTCLGKTLVCVVKTSALSSTIRALEPVDGTIRGRSKTTFRKWVQGTNDALRPYKEFYIPLESSSLHFLKSRICIGCTKGFEIVDLQSLETQGLLDPSDSTLDFVKRREGLVRPMAIFRVDQDFLLCYDEFAFYVNKNGWRARNRFIIFWEGTPSSFALHYPYVLAFEPSFIEVRHVENGALMQVIQGSNLRCLFAENPPSTTNTANSQYSTQHYPARTPYGIAAPGTPYSGRQSVYSQFGTGGPNYGYVHGQDRDEIIMVSEDRVMALRLADQSELQPAVPLQPAAQMSVQNLPQMVAQMSMQQSPAPMPMHALSSAHGHHPQQGPPPQAQMWAAASAPNMYAGPPHGGSPIHHNGNGPYQHPQASYSQTFYGR